MNILLEFCGQEMASATSWITGWIVKGLILYIVLWAARQLMRMTDIEIIEEFEGDGSPVEAIEKEPQPEIVRLINQFKKAA